MLEEKRAEVRGGLVSSIEDVDGSGVLNELDLNELNPLVDLCLLSLKSEVRLVQGLRRLEEGPE